MAASSSVVIKVKYGDSLRRFSSHIIGDELNFTMDGLRKKILSLFSFNVDAELTLTYVDEDGDAVTLADDEDLRDVVRQELNPLRITVKVNAEKDEQFTPVSVHQPLQDPNAGVSEVLGTQPEPLNETVMKLSSDIPLKASSTDRVQQPLQNLNTGVFEILKTVPEPLRGTLVKLSSELASKASSSTPSISDIVDGIAKLGLSYLDQGTKSSQSGGSFLNSVGAIPVSDTAAKETRELGTSAASMTRARPDNESLKKLQPEVHMGSDEVKVYNVNGGSIDESAENIYHGNRGNVLQNSGRPAVTSHGSRKKELLVKKTILNKVNGKPHLTNRLANLDNNVGKPAPPTSPSDVPFVANSFGLAKIVNNPSEPNVGPKTVSADFTVGDCIDKMKSQDLGNASAPYPPFTSYLTYRCPFSQLVMGDRTAVSQPVTEVGSTAWGINQNDCLGNIFHSGVRCDGCGVHPITGPRFKSKIRVDYDLCSICFEELGNINDYIRMDRPAVYRHHASFRGLHDTYQRGRGRSLGQRQFPASFGIKLVAAKPDSLFIRDVNIFDGTVMAPSTPFTKIWRMRNNGIIVWPKQTQLVWIGGYKMSNEIAVEVQIPASGLKVDEEIDVAVDFISPKTHGRFVSYWTMALPSGQKFGQRFWVIILVDPFLEEPSRENVRDLNLNLPPVSSSSNLNLPPVSSSFTGSEIMNVEPDPMVEDGTFGTHESKNVEKLPLQPNVEHELKFPINNSLLVGEGASSSSRPSQQVSYPIIDLSPITYGEALLVEEEKRDGQIANNSFSPATLYPQKLFGSGDPVATAQETAVELAGKMEMEEKLLKELKEMGFKEVDLNKRMLRMNEYDLERAVDDLCGVTEWDPILDELQEMGFNDTETNRMLLKKNNGSIKRVVMDLIAGEKME